MTIFRCEMGRFFRKSYTNCTSEFYAPVRNKVMKIRRLGCPDLIFSGMMDKQDAREDGFELSDRKFSDVQLCFDVLNACYTWSFMLHVDLMMNGRSTFRDTYRANAAICSHISSNMHAIRLLSSKRYQAQARALARSLREFGDLLIACCNDNEFASDFVKHQLDDEASHFWKNWVSRGKLRRRVLNNLRNTIGFDDEVLNDYRNAVEQEEAAFSSAVHGSYSTAIMSNLGELISESLGMEEFHPDQPSQRTLGASVFAVALPMLTLHMLLSQKRGYFELSKDSDNKSLFERTKEINEAFRDLTPYSLYGMYLDQFPDAKVSRISRDGR